MTTLMTTRGRLAFEEYARVLVENGGRRIEWENLSHHQRLGWQCAAHCIAESVTVGEAHMNEDARKTTESNGEIAVKQHLSSNA